MSAVGRFLFRDGRQSFQTFKALVRKEGRNLSTVTPAADESTSKSSKDSKDVKRVMGKKFQHLEKDPALYEYRYVYPEFLPDPKPEFRNALREKLERMDMIARRNNAPIAEFYVGSIVAVTHSDRHAPGKKNRFVGICIERSGVGLNANFILRNVIDSQGVEVMFEIYDPTIQKIDCLRLEKRLDEHLRYLRDAPLEYSTFPFDMEIEILPEGTPVPINPIKVPLNPTPWLERWERADLKGATNIVVNEKRQRKALLHEKPWEKYDLMKVYRETIPMEDQQEIFEELQEEFRKQEISQKKMKRKRVFVRPKKTG